MNIYVALLHSIVLAAGRRVVMDDLRAMAEQAGFSRPRTLAATGNLVIETDETLPVANLERRLEQGIVHVFGKQIDVIGRTAQQWKTLASENPFPSESALNASNVIVRVMRAPLTGDALDRLEPCRSTSERLAVVNGDLWISFGAKPSESRLLSQLTTRRLGAGTLRNWNTVRRLAGMLD
ncbi:MAG: DUF1697 domain-containing protein [Phyllobacterium sp.]